MNAAVQYHVDAASAEALVTRLDGVQKSGNGWRARCPSCGGASRKVSITQANNAVLIHCFGGCAVIDVLHAVGLTWADVMPPRHWPSSPEERRQARRAAREGALIAALPDLAYAAAVVRIAAQQVMQVAAFDPNDYATLLKAEEVIGNARSFFCEPARNRPAVTS